MKSLLLLAIPLIFIIGVSCGQVFVGYGTGVRDIQPQYQLLPTMKYGCLVMACCVVGGLGTTSQVLAARQWALENGYISSSNYVQIGSMDLAQKISRKYGTTYHSDFVIRKDNYGNGGTHFWVANSSGKEIFNSAGLGWHGN